MGANPRTKGQTGEREIAKLLNDVYHKVYNEAGRPLPEDPVQRNQLQTAVGGCDLVGTLDFAIEVKRQEQLSVNTWWAQAIESAKRLNHQPVLIYRQNKRKWMVVMYAQLHLMDRTKGDHVWARVEVSMDDFLKLFEKAVRNSM